VDFQHNFFGLWEIDYKVKNDKNYEILIIFLITMSEKTTLNYV